jgi:hypothetical protein
MSTILSTEVVPSTAEQQTLLVYDLLDAHHDTAPLAADGGARRALGGAAGLLGRSPAPGPVVRSAFVYEAADIRPGMAINEYRSERAGNRHRRGLHAWLRRLFSRGKCAQLPDLRSMPYLECRQAETMKGTAMTTTSASGGSGKDRGDAAPHGRHPAAPWDGQVTQPAAPCGAGSLVRV